MHSKALNVACASLAMLASVQAASSQTCDLLKSQSSFIQSLRSPQFEFSKEQSNYWSMGCTNLKPACILAPKDANETSIIMQTLYANNETFAVKSGGHNPNNYWASIDNGPLISTRALTEVTYDNVTNTVVVGPGNKWEDVHAALEGTGVTVVGGRIGNVGVGGYLLGGGLSFLSSQYGWASNNIVAAEMVLANGTIITASSTSHPEVLAAIKGGGNAYGIVTRYVLQAHPIGKVWGGNLLFGKEATDKLLAAVRNFTENYDSHPKAGIIATAELTALNAADMWIIFLFYDGETPPAGVFDEFLAAGPTLNNCKTRTYSDLLTFNNWAVLHGSIYTIATETTPLPSAADGARVMRSYYDHWHSNSAKHALVPGIVSSMALQPIPKRLARLAREAGGDLLDLDDEVDRIIFEFDYSYWFASDDKTVDQTMVDLYSGMKTLVDGHVANGTLPDAYRPIFMNDAYFRQDYWGRMRPAKRQFASDVRRAVDPEDVFYSRTGGIKM